MRDPVPHSFFYSCDLFKIQFSTASLHFSLPPKKSNNRTWYRIARDIKETTDIITKGQLREWVLQLDKKLQNYKPYKVKSYD